MLGAFDSILVFLIGIAGGFFDSTVGSGGLITIPSLIFLGLPPAIAIATDRLGTVGQTLAALFKFSKAKKILWQYVPAFTLLALIGAFLGANILLAFDPVNLQKVVGVILLIILPFLFLSKNAGTKRIKVNKLQKALGYIVYFLIMIYNGFFGTGAGPFSFYNSIFLFGFTIIEAKATGIIPWFALSLLSLIIFGRHGVIDYQKGIVLFLGMAAGGYFGAQVALEKGDLWIKRLFALVVIFSAFKLLF